MASSGEPAAIATPAAGLSELKPTGGWLKDAQGREYYIDRIPKTQARRLDQKTVIGFYGFRLDVVREDDKFYYYKIYKPLPNITPAPLPTPSAQEQQKILESYHTGVKPSSRLRFMSFDAGLPRSGQWRQGFAIADMNRDGHPDIIFPPARQALPPVPEIFLGDGKGNWSLWHEAHFPPLLYDYGDVRVADFNGDGIPDLAFGVHMRGLIVLLGDGKGGFRDASTGLDFAAKGGRAFSSQALQVIDWEKNGKADILALAEGPFLIGPKMHYPHGVVLYLNQGNGAWKRAPGASSDIYGRSLVIGDFEGNGHLGFATGTNVGDRRDLVHLWKSDGSWKTVTVNEIRPMAYVWSVAAADFDGDGRADLAVAYLSSELGTWRSGIDIIYSRPQGHWERRPLFVTKDTKGPVALGVGDLLGTGHKDLVATTAKGETLVFLADGKGFFTQETTPPPVYPGRCKGSHVELADLDGDGKDELVTSFSDVKDETGHCPSEGGVTVWKARAVEAASSR
ncbi:MAG: VCBS repeat-containing protein [Deltaproteobacteria bacterium]|nr:VCBS repeat-containing protein [Deltaproteobacteria bacterium]